MAIFTYADHASKPDIQTQLAVLSEQTQSTRGLLALLGDFWQEYYQDADVLQQAVSGHVANVGRVFDRAIETLLSANIIDYPVEQGQQFDLFVFNKADFETVLDENGEVDSFFVSLDGCDVSYINYLTVSLFESPVILEKNVHFKVEQDVGIYFYVDIFNDPSIVTYEYEVNDSATQSVLLWGTSIALSSFYIYERYGRFLYRKAIDSYQYRWAVTSLMRFYTNAKTPTNIKKILDILFGIPYARYEGEVIQEITYVDDNLEDWTEESTIEAPYIRIVTDRNTYYTYGLTELNYGVGDAVPKNALFGEFCDVHDYINTPNWWVPRTDADDAVMAFPHSMIADGADVGLSEQDYYDIMDKYLKYNTVYTQVNITYETYQLYKTIINDIYDIISGGFPVYLYTFIEVVFRTRWYDNANIRENCKDWLELWGNLTWVDEFCEYFKYNGKYDHNCLRPYNGYACGERLADFIDLALAFTFKDHVHFTDPRYNGRFFYNGDIFHHTPKPALALDFSIMHLDLAAFEEKAPEAKENWLANVDVQMLDYFTRLFCYDAHEFYNGRLQHAGFRNIDEKLVIGYGLTFVDKVPNLPLLHDGRHKYDGLIHYRQPETFALDKIHDIAIEAAEVDEYPEVVESATANISYSTIDWFDRPVSYDAEFTHDGIANYSGYLRLMDTTPLAIAAPIVETFEDTQTPLYYDDCARYDGRVAYDGISPDVATDLMLITLHYSDGRVEAV